MLEHIFVPRVWVFEPIESAKSACFGSCHQSNQEWFFPLAVHLPLQFALRDMAKHEVTFLDFPRPDFLIAPPSDFLLVSAEVDRCLDFDSFDCVSSWLHILIGILLSVRPMMKLFRSHGFFAIEKLEGIELSSS